MFLGRCGVVIQMQPFTPLHHCLMKVRAWSVLAIISNSIMTLKGAMKRDVLISNSGCKRTFLRDLIKFYADALNYFPSVPASNKTPAGVGLHKK